ncbi:hypothetical protein HMPREF9098_2084 [Kingella denitrificans ATCC 33394]|uniref:Uncharacterized protein n=1 Tax=Kingella denitrificans ATCC 33394 TaxID=888741 RepID=F0F1U9_9NEIS|nr:hypothetical protein HMPREF9098_2084 [Kingella denitrificans ATCC 33394]
MGAGCFLEWVWRRYAMSCRCICRCLRGGGVQAAFDVSGGFKSSLHSSNSRCRLLFGFWHGGYTNPAA